MKKGVLILGGKNCIFVKKKTMIPKPRHCNQDWLKMEKTDGGRICGKCEQKMVEFAKMNWEIHTIIMTIKFI